MRKIHGEYYILSPGEGALKFTMCTHACPEVFKICLNKVSVGSGQDNKGLMQKVHGDRLMTLWAWGRGGT